MGQDSDHQTEEQPAEWNETDGEQPASAPIQTSMRIGAFLFEDRDAFEAAKKDSEAAAYIRAHSDLNQIETVRKIYTKLVQKGNFQTPIGLTFLWELQLKLTKNGVTREELAPIPVRRESRLKRKRRVEQPQGAKAEQLRKEFEQLYRSKFRNYKIITCFMAVLVLVLFIMAWIGRPASDSEIREEILNEYAGWQEELEQREAALEGNTQGQQ